MVRARQTITLQLIGALDDLAVVEIGCGTDLLVARTPEATFSDWVIVEPNSTFAAGALAYSSADPRVQVIDAFFEHATDNVLAACRRRPDIVLCSSVLHEVDEPTTILACAHQLLAPGGRLIVNVPNALSLHRRLAVTMGLISSATELSVRNAQLRQPRVLDATGLADLLASSGFTITATGGYFLKPFTHAQMTELPFLDDRMIDGLAALGADLPDLAAEIYAVATADGPTDVH